MATKQKTVRKTASKKAARPTKLDYPVKAAATILAIWGVILLGVAVFNAIGLAQYNEAMSLPLMLVNLFSTILISLAVLIIFKTVKSLLDLEDDGYLAAIIIIMNAGLVGYNGFTSSTQFNGGYFWPILILAFLGLLFLLPQYAKFRQTADHSLTTWTIILHVLLWFSIVVLTSMAINTI